MERQKESYRPSSRPIAIQTVEMACGMTGADINIHEVFCCEP